MNIFFRRILLCTVFLVAFQNTSYLTVQQPTEQAAPERREKTFVQRLASGDREAIKAVLKVLLGAAVTGGLSYALCRALLRQQDKKKPMLPVKAGAGPLAVRRSAAGPLPLAGQLSVVDDDGRDDDSDRSGSTSPADSTDDSYEESDDESGDAVVPDNILDSPPAMHIGLDNRQEEVRSPILEGQTARLSEDGPAGSPVLSAWQDARTVSGLADDAASPAHAQDDVAALGSVAASRSVVDAAAQAANDENSAVDYLMDDIARYAREHGDVGGYHFPSGNTYLGNAVIRRLEPVAQYLVSEHGVDPRAPADAQGHSAIELAFERGLQDLVNFFMDAAGRDPEPSAEGPAAAAPVPAPVGGAGESINEEPRVAGRLAQALAPVPAGGAGGPVERSTIVGDIIACRARGGSVTGFRYANGQTFFIRAVYGGDMAAVEYLVDECQADINAPLNAKGDTALHLACEVQHPAVVRFLLARGADALKTNNEGRIPWCFVDYEGANEEIRAMLQPQEAAAATEEPAQNEERDRDRECPICYEPYGGKLCSTTRCGHKFHTECLDEWRQKSATCPYCRQPI